MGIIFRILIKDGIIGNNGEYLRMMCVHNEHHFTK